jgi:hypothetical protein
MEETADKIMQRSLKLWLGDKAVWKVNWTDRVERMTSVEGVSVINDDLGPSKVLVDKVGLSPA